MFGVCLHHPFVAWSVEVVMIVKVISFEQYFRKAELEYFKRIKVGELFPKGSEEKNKALS